MTHQEADRVYPDYQAGRLDREKTRAFHQHLKECEACQARVRLQNTWSKAGRALPPDFNAETQRSIARNRDLLVKLLLLMVAAWAVARMKL